MTVAALTTSSQSPFELPADVLVLGVRKTEDGAVLLNEAVELEPLRLSLASMGVTGGQDELHRVPALHAVASSIALIGIGSDNPSAAILRYAAGSATRQLRGVESIVIALPTNSDDDVLAVLEGAAIGAYSYTRYRASSVDAAKQPASRIIVATTNTNAGLDARATVIAAAIHTVRDLVNDSPLDLYPESFAATAVELAESSNVSVEVFGDAELADGGFGGIIAVGMGSTRTPRLVKVTYEPGACKKHLALVGKGITFDSGGLSLKPPASMIGMKYDMTGAATVLAVVIAASKLELPIKITSWLCIAENMPSGSALRPGDVITIRGGKTVEVLNTDAEGRLVLADGLVAASEEQPDFIIDVATLTGAALVALGNRYVGTMGDDALVAQLVAAGGRVGETLWPMPIPSEVRPLLASDIADIANIKPGNTAAGMLLAAAFLRDFVGTSGVGEDKHTIPWAHLDIAGPANNGGSGWGFTGKGPTGVAVRALLELAEEISGQ